MIDFATFFSAVHARQPYPWQVQLAQRLATATPPRAIVVPTGGGKTATLDALVYALAIQARRSPPLRTIGVRLVWAIDRRVLVDEVHARATLLAARLADAAKNPDDVLHGAARELSSLCHGPPLVATRWRGGIAPEHVAHHPFQPEVITSTIAQIGSRLLFRGYGVGSRSLALAAGLAGVDTTICLDEAHLAGPFRETVAAVRRLRDGDPVALPPLGLITLSATPDDAVAPQERVEIGEKDRAVLGKRLTGSKTAVLVEPASPKDGDRRIALVEAVMRHLDAGRRLVACVVNTVRMAVEIAAELERRMREADRLLLIGPQRPFDREAGLALHRATLFERAPAAQPLVVIATQTFEVGLDADVEALVTESASATALVQRLGRLNRAGGRDGHATIVRDRDAWLYEGEEAEAWEWLSRLRDAHGQVDVSVEALSEAPGMPVALVRATAPELDRAVVDRLVQTEPRPARSDDPDIDPFLNGVEAEPAADVHVAWRRDLRSESADDEYRRALLTLAPPQVDELVTIGIGRARALLASMAGASAAITGRVLDEPDVEGGRGEAPVPDGLSHGTFARCVVRGGEVLAGSVDLRPGDILVLPCQAGGYTTALAPGSTFEVSEAAPDARALATGGPPPPFVRLGDEVLRAAITSDTDRRSVLRLARTIARNGSDPRALLARLAPLAVGDDAQVDLRAVATEADFFAGDIDEEDDVNVEPAELSTDDSEHAPLTDVFVLTIRPRLDPEELPRPGAQPPTLWAHAERVERCLDTFASVAALREPIPATLRLAAVAHDHGKADPRIQAHFRGGRSGLGDVLLAKSTFGTKDLRADRAARRAAGVPVDLRHEVESVGVLLDALEREPAPDVDIGLLLYLVGTHHGLGRPVPRLPRGGVAPRRYLADVGSLRGIGTGDGRPATRDGVWVARFLKVVERYGAWGSAYLAALLMLADRTVSAEGG